MSSNDESLKDTKSLHKTSVSDEVVIKFDHVTKTYCTRTIAGVSWASSTTTARALSWEASMPARTFRSKSRRARPWLFSAATAQGRARR